MGACFSAAEPLIVSDVIIPKIVAEIESVIIPKIVSAMEARLNEIAAEHAPQTTTL
jgi:hypothetical protein